MKKTQWLWVQASLALVAAAAAVMAQRPPGEGA